MDGLISRQSLIDALLELKVEHRVSWRDAVIDMIDAEPSAQPERNTERWIPVTERLPDQSDVFLVTLDDKYGPVTYVALWQDNAWVSADDIFLLGDTEITAWMPRPEPWGGDA